MTRGCCPRGGASIITGLLAGLFLVLVTVLSVDAAGTATSTKGTATTTKQQTQPTTTQQQQTQTLTDIPIVDSYIIQGYEAAGPLSVAYATAASLVTHAGPRKTWTTPFTNKTVRVLDLQGATLTISALKPGTAVYLLSSGNQIIIILLPKGDRKDA
jgi:hypothetical protein